MVNVIRRLPTMPAIVLAFTAASQDGVLFANENLNVNSIVQVALQAEVDGDSRRCQILLDRVLQRDPNLPQARWHSGHVQVKHQWLTLDQAEERALRLGKVAKYRSLRDAYAGSLAGELALARWCRKYDFHNRERLHWTGALQLDPSNLEARRRLGVRMFKGHLLTPIQIKEWRQSIRAYQVASQYWNPRLKRWRSEIETAPEPDQTEAWQELARIVDAAAVPLLERTFATSKPEVHELIVEILGNIEEQIATDTLVRMAIYGSSSTVRWTAAEKLRGRSWYEFVPNLLDRLHSPVEGRYFVHSFEGTLFSVIRYSHEQPSRVVNVSRSVTAQYPVVVMPNTTEKDIRQAYAQQRVELAKQASDQYQRVSKTIRKVQDMNALTSSYNEPIFAALRTSTYQQIESQPQLWRDWWKNYNELDEGPYKPEIDFYSAEDYGDVIVTTPSSPPHPWSPTSILNVPGPIRRSSLPGPIRPLRYTRNKQRSCFPAGTLVWTETGPVAIENMRRGDQVLSQHPDSGELTYQVVLDTTIRSPSQTLQIHVGDEQIESTLGHPFWVVGDGWQMAKELKAGDRLHSLQGSATIDKIEPGDTVEAYNLVVAETNTYFVGEHRVLVHDNVLRRTSNLPVPGW